MPKWIQDPETNKLVPADEYYARPVEAAPGIFVRPDVHFRSPVDGSAVTSERKLREHNKRNNVVHESEFGAAGGRDFFKRKAAERADHYQGTTHTVAGKREQQNRRRAVIEALRRHTNG